MARRSARGRYRAALPGLRPARHDRAPVARGTARRLRQPRRSRAQRRRLAAGSRRSPGSAALGGVTAASSPAQSAGGLAVLRNRSFLLLWLSQLATQIGTNMVLYGLT